MCGARACALNYHEGPCPLNLQHLCTPTRSRQHETHSSRQERSSKTAAQDRLEEPRAQQVRLACASHTLQHEQRAKSSVLFILNADSPLRSQPLPVCQRKKYKVTESTRAPANSLQLPRRGAPAGACQLKLICKLICFLESWQMQLW
jgi:hypothetical protein